GDDELHLVGIHALDFALELIGEKAGSANEDQGQSRHKNTHHEMFLQVREARLPLSPATPGEGHFLAAGWSLYERVHDRWTAPIYQPGAIVGGNAWRPPASAARTLPGGHTGGGWSARGDFRYVEKMLTE